MQHGRRATLKSTWKSTPWKEYDMKKGQHEKIATRGKCIMEKLKHGKSATQKKYNKKIVQHKEGAEADQKKGQKKSAL